MVPDNSLPYGLDYVETLSLEAPVVSQPVPDPSGSMEAGNGVEPGNNVGDDMEIKLGKPRKLSLTVVEQVSVELPTGLSKKPSIDYTHTASSTKTLFSQDLADGPIPVLFQYFRIVYCPPFSRRISFRYG